jgi:putative membrane protein
MAEVELGKLAQQRGTGDQVKEFGDHMVQDHSKANEELKTIAAAKGVQVPVDLDEKHKAAMQMLQKLSGGEFDRAYMKQMVADHKQTVADFKRQAESGKDADVKSFAASTLPKLEEHLKMAQSVSESTKTSMGEAGTKSSY